MKTTEQFSRIHDWFMTKWKARSTVAGIFVTATQMRKQGVPIDIALLALVGRA